MKCLLVFALCAVACCLAVPSSRSCEKEQLDFCPKGPESDVIRTEEDLDQSCRQIECWIEVADRCGDDYFGPIGYFPINGYRKAVEELCYESSPIRRKFINSAECIKDAMNNDRDVLERCGLKGDTRREFCRNYPDGIKCAVDYITRKCGQDAGDVLEVSSPGLDPYDCRFD